MEVAMAVARSVAPSYTFGRGIRTTGPAAAARGAAAWRPDPRIIPGRRRRLVRHLRAEWATVQASEMGGLRSCLTQALLAMARAGRVDDVKDVMAVCDHLDIRIHAGALQARASAGEDLRGSTFPRQRLVNRQKCGSLACAPGWQRSGAQPVSDNEKRVHDLTSTSTQKF